MRDAHYPRLPRMAIVIAFLSGVNPDEDCIVQPIRNSGARRSPPLLISHACWKSTVSRPNLCRRDAYLRGAVVTLGPIIFVLAGV